MRSPRLIRSALLFPIRNALFSTQRRSTPKSVPMYLENDRPQPHHEAVPTSRAVPLCVHQVPDANDQSQRVGCSDQSSSTAKCGDQSTARAECGGLSITRTGCSGRPITRISYKKTAHQIIPETVYRGRIGAPRRQRKQLSGNPTVPLDERPWSALSAVGLSEGEHVKYQ